MDLPPVNFLSRIAVRTYPKIILLLLIVLLRFTVTAWGQDTTGVIRIGQGMPQGLQQIERARLSPALQVSAERLAVQYGYKPNKDWADTVKYWTDEQNLRAVSFINSSYEYTTVVFTRRGQWLQTTTYPNPEFIETARILDVLEDKGYSVADLKSPVGPILKYKTARDTWYEAGAYENGARRDTACVLLDRKFRFLQLKK